MLHYDEILSSGEEETPTSVVYSVDCTQRNYANSVAYCESQGKSMATVHSQEDNDAINELFQAKSCDKAYIGAYRKDKQSNWSWDDGSEWDY